MNPFFNLRESKGMSLIDFPDEFVVVDLETTGLDPVYDYIIEIGAIRFSKGVEVERFCELVRPDEYMILDEEDLMETDDYRIIDGQPTRYISNFITELTGITNKMLESARGTKEVLTDFDAFLSDDIIVGHNVNFDVNFLYESFLQHLGKPLRNNFIDTMRISRRLLAELNHHSLKDLATYYKVSYGGAHRAINDCFITFKCFLGLKETAIERYNSIEEFKNETLRRSTVSAKDIVTTKTSFDEDHPLFGKICVFTGRLEGMTREEAMQIVADLGGINSNTVTVDTDYLILGNLNYSKQLKGGKSNKHKKAEELMLKGSGISIITENVFFDLVGDEY
ncbi:MAG: exonuclease [Clostridiales bacterium]|nr:exonuclease [Clostridiales bacterium]